MDKLKELWSKIDWRRFVVLDFLGRLFEKIWYDWFTVACCVLGILFTLHVIIYGGP